MLEVHILAPSSEITAKGDGAAIDLSAASSRVFLVLLEIRQIVEQESFELTIFGSSDGATWATKPLLRFPQRFYRGETPMLLDLTAQPDVRFVRAHWDVNRWGRGSEKPRFAVGIRLREVPAPILAQVK
jgi:hypothetical protein